MVKVLAFGTFDPLHEGHSHFFRQAKSLGDHLAVVVALDSTITQYKHRLPHQSQTHRLKQVQADPSVDLVILGDQQPKQHRLLTELDFDILVLGYDQSPSDDEVKDHLIQAGKKKVKIIRLQPHQAHRFKSKKIRRQAITPLFDCHLHSNNSDGRLSASALVAAANQLGLSGISLTDHNGTWGVKEASAAAAKYNINFLAGIEISAVWQHQRFHLLAYSLNFNLPLLEQGLAGVRQAHLEKIKAMISKCSQQGYSKITFTAVSERRRQQKNPVYLFSDLAQLLHQRHQIPWRNAWALTVKPGACYVPIKNNKLLALTSALDLIHQAGGIASLAHPGLIKKTAGSRYLSRLLTTLITSDLDAIEVYHPDNGALLTKHLAKLVVDNNLLTTGGSDWHGPGIHKNRKFGKIGLDQSQWQRLLAKLD